MRTLLTRVLLVNGVLAFTTAAVLLFGRTLPVSPLVQLWHLDDCAPPCWLDMIPGESSYGDTQQRLAEGLGMPATRPEPHLSFPAELYLTLPLPHHRNAETTVPAAITFRMNFDRAVIQRITIPYSGDTSDLLMPRLGDIVVTYGVPTCVNLQTGWSLYYDTPDGVTQVAVLGGDRLWWTQPIYYLSFWVHTSESVKETCFSGSDLFHPWRGLNRARYE